MRDFVDRGRDQKTPHGQNRSGRAPGGAVRLDRHGAGFGDVGVEAQPEWHDLYTRVYRVAVDSLQGEARRRLPEAGLMRRVVVTATAPRLAQ